VHNINGEYLTRDNITAGYRANGNIHSGIRYRTVSDQQQTQKAIWLRGDATGGMFVRLTLDTCVFHTPMVCAGTKVIMTNSGKCAYYAPGELGVQVAFGSMAECVESAIKGYVCRKEIVWEES
jgi:hypothetical protein